MRNFRNYTRIFTRGCGSATQYVAQFPGVLYGFPRAHVGILPRPRKRLFDRATPLYGGDELAPLASSPPKASRKCLEPREPDADSQHLLPRPPARQILR